jgi:hypothetical protein
MGSWVLNDTSAGEAAASGGGQILFFARPVGPVAFGLAKNKI